MFFNWIENAIFAIKLYSHHELKPTDTNHLSQTLWVKPQRDNDNNELSKWERKIEWNEKWGKENLKKKQNWPYTDTDRHTNELWCDKITMKWMLTFRLLAWFTTKLLRICNSISNEIGYGREDMRWG